MATTEKTFETIPAGTDVTWHYRSAIGHGTVIGVHRPVSRSISRPAPS